MTTLIKQKKKKKHKKKNRQLMRVGIAANKQMKTFKEKIQSEMHALESSNICLTKNNQLV